ncbi:MAG: hypothetical protein ACRDOH_27280, partial [Streptosporangiaceae bacterium]
KRGKRPVQDLDPGEQGRLIRQPLVCIGPDLVDDPALQCVVARDVIPGDRRGGRVNVRAGEQQCRVWRAAECLQQFGEDAQAGPQLRPSAPAAQLMQQIGRPRPAPGRGSSGRARYARARPCRRRGPVLARCG